MKQLRQAEANTPDAQAKGEREYPDQRCRRSPDLR
jgi:hypothetical protein